MGRKTVEAPQYVMADEPKEKEIDESRRAFGGALALTAAGVFLGNRIIHSGEEYAVPRLEASMEKAHQGFRTLSTLDGAIGDIEAQAATDDRLGSEPVVSKLGLLKRQRHTAAVYTRRQLFSAGGALAELSLDFWAATTGVLGVRTALAPTRQVDTGGFELETGESLIAGNRSDGFTWEVGADDMMNLGTRDRYQVRGSGDDFSL